MHIDGMKMIIKDIIKQPLMIKTMQVSSPRGRNENILSEREIINAIDLCPQIMKQDKLFIRNKIKQFFREYQLSGFQTPPELIELLQIFSDCKKPLNKVHLYENQLHWLQVKLRKYITNERKKYKQQCLNQFKRDKCHQQTRRTNMMQRKIRNDDIHQYNNWIIGPSDSELKSHCSQQHYRADSSSQHFNQTKRINKSKKGKHLSGNISPAFQAHHKYFPAQSCKNSNPNHLKPNWDNYFPYKPSRSNSRDKQGRQHKQKYRQQMRVNKQNQQYACNTNQDNSVIINQVTQNQQFPYYYAPDNSFEGGSHSRNKSTSRSDQKKFDEIEIRGHYKGIGVQEVNNNRNPQFSSIKHLEEQTYAPNSTVSNFGNNINKQEIFTSPQLLEECRRLIKHSQQQHEKIKNIMKKSKRDQFSDTKVFGQIQCNQYDSPKFSHRSIEQKLPPFNTFKQLLAHIFHKDWRVFLSQELRRQIVDRSPSVVEKQVGILLSKVNPNTNFISFIDLVPFLKSCSDIYFNFSNIFQLFDVDGKGFIRSSDFQTFLQNFADCPIEPNILMELKSKLQKFQMTLQRVFKSTEIISGCFEYLQLIENPQIFQLCQLLQLFQFQIDTASSATFTNDMLQ